MPDTSGVQSSPTSFDVSLRALTPKLATRPGLSKGLAVPISMTEPIPPDGIVALKVLKTLRARTPSVARLAKSNERTESVLRSVPGICRPLSNTRLNSGPKPRTVTRLPSLLERSIDTPGIRCIDSARFVSGNWPMSSAVIASTTPREPRLVSIDDIRLPRIPTVTISSITSSCPCALVGTRVDAPSATATPAASGVLLKELSCI